MELNAKIFLETDGSYMLLVEEGKGTEAYIEVTEAELKQMAAAYAEVSKKKKEGGEAEKSPRARKLKEIRNDVEALRKRIKTASSYTDIIEIRKNIKETLKDKISLWGGEYGSSGEAQEIYDEILEDLEEEMKGVFGHIEKAETEKMVKKVQEHLAKSKARKEESVELTTAEKKKKLKEIVKDAALHAQKVYEENKGKGNTLIGKAEEKLRGSRIYPGGGETVMLTDKEFLTIVSKYYTKDRK